MSTRKVSRNQASLCRLANCNHCAPNHEIWNNLDTDEVTTLNLKKNCNVYQPGQMIFYQGNPCMGLYCVEAGSIALRKTDIHGNAMVVRISKEHEVLGYRSFFSQGPYTASAEALTECRVCFIDKLSIQEMLADNPTLGYAFLERMAEDLRISEESRLQLSTLSVRARLAHLLLIFKEHYGEMNEEGELMIDLPLSRQDLASMLSIRIETLSRTIQALKKDKVAIFNRRRVTVPDIDALFDEIEDWTV